MFLISSVPSCPCSPRLEVTAAFPHPLLLDIFVKPLFVVVLSLLLVNHLLVYIKLEAQFIKFV